MNGPLLLVSDDEPSIGAALRRRLHARGIEVYIDVCADVVELAAALRPDAILLDLLQRRDGVALLQELKGRPDTRETPAFLMSGAFGPDVLGEISFAPAIALGALAVIPKPIPEEFIDRLADFLLSCHGRPAAIDVDSLPEEVEVDLELDSHRSVDSMSPWR